MRIFNYFALTIIIIGFIGGYYGPMVEAKHILGLFFFPAKSHYDVVESIMMELSNRGHQITEYSPFYRDRSHLPYNYRHVDVSECFRMPERNLTADYLLSVTGSTYKALNALLTFVPDYRALEECGPIVNLLRLSRQAASQYFDLVITEVFNSEISLLIAYKLGVPFVQVLINQMFLWRTAIVGNPYYPSYMPLTTEPYAGWRMNSFPERLRNVYAVILSDYMYDRMSTRITDHAGKRLLGESAPSVREIAKNTSMIFLHSHVSLNDVRPLAPSVVEIGGVAIKLTIEPLPTDIETFINESEHGVVYFCMGSLLRGSSFPEEKRNAFLYAFSKIPQRVLWKWEGDELPGKSDKIMTSKWMPQRDILAHPKVKLFISHGGLLGTNEAVYEGVPILGIPIFGDQRTNVRSIEASGAGEMLDYNEISNEVVLEKIQRLINYPKYRENAEQLSRRYRDRPMPPLDTAVYWTEYVIRHKGAPHLRSPAVDMPWYQYLLLDVIAFVIFVLVATLVVIYYVLKFTLRILLRILFRIFTRKPNVSKTSKKVD